MISLFYRAWEKYRFSVAYEREATDRVTEYLMDSSVSARRASSTDRGPDESPAFLCRRAAPQPRSAGGLEQVLADSFGCPWRCEQFVGAWYDLDRWNPVRLGQEAGASDQLGLGAIVGDEIWDQQSDAGASVSARSRAPSIGSSCPAEPRAEPGRWHAFLPAGRSISNVQLVLQRDEVPTCESGRRRNGAAVPGVGELWLQTGASEHGSRMTRCYRSDTHEATRRKPEGLIGK